MVSWRARTLSLVAAALLVTGCAAQPTAETPPPTTSVAPAPAPTPTPTETEAVLTEPVQAFGGDCAAVLPDPGVFVSGITDSFQALAPAGMNTLGGLYCRWSAGEHDWISVAAVPSALMPDDLRAQFAEPVCEAGYDITSCSVVVEARDVSIFLEVAPEPMASYDEPLAVRDLSALTTELIRSADAAPAAARLPLSDGWWPVDVCERLPETLDLAALLGTDNFYQGYPTGFGYSFPVDVGERTGVEIGCPWAAEAEGGRFWMTLYPGAAWAWSNVADREGAIPADVEGAADAVILPDDFEGRLLATDGVNVVSVTMSTVPREHVAAVVLAALS